MDAWLAVPAATATVLATTIAVHAAGDQLRSANDRAKKELNRRAADGRAVTSALAESLGLENAPTGYIPGGPGSDIGGGRRHGSGGYIIDGGGEPPTRTGSEPGGPSSGERPSAGPQTVLAASAASWNTENESLTSSATSRRNDARRYSQIAAWVGLLGAAFFTLGILWAVMSGSATTGLSALIGLLPGGVAVLVLSQARQATADARSDEAELRTQVDYQRRAAYAWEVVHSVSDPARRDEALRALAVALAPHS